MLGLFCEIHKRRILLSFGVTVLRKSSSPIPEEAFFFGPFNSHIQRRWKKPVITAQTRLEDRTRDLRLDKLVRHFKRLMIVLNLRELMLNYRGYYVSVQLMSRWRNILGLNIGMGGFLRKYPHIFEIYSHPSKRNLCCKLTQKMTDLVEEEHKLIKETELIAIHRVMKLLMISTSGTLHIHALWLIRRELGLPDDFRHSILPKYPEYFRLVNPEIVALVPRDETSAVAEVEKWREREYKEKWLSEFETKYAFPINFPTGFKIEKGFREKLKNWQRLPYLNPYEKKEAVRARTCSGIERFEKRAVGILHEFLSLTVEKMVEVERLSHFKRDFNMEINVRELLLKHPGVFYISTKGDTQTVFLREAYRKGCLIEPNPVYTVRRKILELILLRCRNTREMCMQKKFEAKVNERKCSDVGSDLRYGDWVIPILESSGDQSVNGNSEISGTSNEEIGKYFKLGGIDSGCNHY